MYNIVCMYSLEKWDKWTYLESRIRDTDIENKHVDRWEGWWDGLGDCDWHVNYFVWDRWLVRAYCIARRVGEKVQCKKCKLALKIHSSIHLLFSLLNCVQLFCNPIDCSLPGSSVQARILRMGVISFSRRSSWPRDQTHISCIERRFFIAESLRNPPQHILDADKYCLNPLSQST